MMQEQSQNYKNHVYDSYTENQNEQIEMQQLRNSNVSNDQQGIKLSQKTLDTLTLGPLSKYQKNNKFPFKLITHTFLCIFTTLQVLQYISNKHLNLQTQQNSWEQILMGEVSDNNYHWFYTVDDFQEQLQNMFKAVNTFDELSFQSVQISEKTQSFIEFEYNYPMQNAGQFTDQNNNPYVFSFDLQKGIFKPFNMDNIQSIKQWLMLQKAFRINITNILLSEITGTTCWDINITYKIFSGLLIQGQLRTQVLPCLNDKGDNITDYIQENPVSYFYAAVVLLLAFMCIGQSLKYIYNISTLFIQVKQNNQFFDLDPRRKIKDKHVTKTEAKITINDIIQSKKNWSQLTNQEKLTFFDFWFIYTFIGNILQIYSTVDLLMANEGHDAFQPMQKWMLGLSCFFSWSNIIKYLKYHNKIDIIMNVIVNAFPRIMIETVGFIPILMMYIMIGMSCFTESNRFISFDMSLVTLFSLLLGDSVNDITQDLKENSVNSVLGILFTISFCFCFMLAVHNIWIAIIMEELKKKKEKDLQVEQQLKNEQQQKQFKKNITLNQNNLSLVREMDENKEKPGNLEDSQVEYQLMKDSFEKQFEKQSNPSYENTSSESEETLQENQEFELKESEIQPRYKQAQSAQPQQIQQLYRTSIDPSNISNRQRTISNIQKTSSSDSNKLRFQKQLPFQKTLSQQNQLNLSRKTSLSQSQILKEQKTIQKKHNQKQQVKFTQITMQALQRMNEGDTIRLKDFIEEDRHRTNIIESIEEQIIMVNKDIKFLLKDSDQELNQNLSSYLKNYKDQQYIANKYHNYLSYFENKCQKINKHINQNIYQLKNKY